MDTVTKTFRNLAWSIDDDADVFYRLNIVPVKWTDRDETVGLVGIGDPAYYSLGYQHIWHRLHVIIEDEADGFHNTSIVLEVDSGLKIHRQHRTTYCYITEEGAQKIARDSLFYIIEGSWKENHYES